MSFISILIDNKTIGKHLFSVCYQNIPLFNFSYHLLIELSIFNFFKTISTGLFLSLSEFTQ